MATVRLETGVRANLPNDNLRVELTSTGSKGVALSAVHADGTPASTRSGHGMLWIEAPRQPLLIRAISTSGQPFSATKVSVVIGTMRQQDDQALLRDVDLDGLSEADLVRVDLVGDYLRLTLVPRTNEEQLSELGRRARALARQRLGLTQIEAKWAVPIKVVVDGSASMLPAFRSGLVGQLVETLTGVAAVVSSTSLDVVVSGAESRCVGSVEAADIRSALESVLCGIPLSTGFRLAPDANEDSGLLLVITDGMTSDPLLGGANLIVLAEPRAWEARGGGDAWTVDPDRGLEEDVVLKRLVDPIVDAAVRRTEA